MKLLFCVLIFRCLKTFFTACTKNVLRLDCMQTSGDRTDDTYYQNS
nr:MAG TPA: hypothetical protein [Caudoviricetes sp.]